MHRADIEKIISNGKVPILERLIRRYDQIKEGMDVTEANDVKESILSPKSGLSTRYIHLIIVANGITVGCISNWTGIDKEEESYFSSSSSFEERFPKSGAGGGANHLPPKMMIIPIKGDTEQQQQQRQKTMSLVEYGEEGDGDGDENTDDENDSIDDMLPSVKKTKIDDDEDMAMFSKKQKSTQHQSSSSSSTNNGKKPPPTMKIQLLKHDNLAGI